MLACNSSRLHKKTARIFHWANNVENGTPQTGAYKLLHEFRIELKPEKKGINGVPRSVVSRSRSFANSTSIFPQEPLSNTMYVIAVATIQPSHLIISFVFLLSMTIKHLHMWSRKHSFYAMCGIIIKTTEKNYIIVQWSLSKNLGFKMKISGGKKKEVKGETHLTNAAPPVVTGGG